MPPLYLRLSSFYFAYFLMLGAFAPFFGLYLKDLGFSSLEIGVLLAIVPVVRTALPTVWGWIADHYGHRRALIRLDQRRRRRSSAPACCSRTSFGWLFAVLLLLNVFWCAALPLVEATTFGLLKGRLGDYGRIRVWGSVSFVLAVLALGPALDRAGVGILPAVLVVLFAARGGLRLAAAGGRDAGASRGARLARPHPAPA